jgi:hypothetical protein
VGAESCAKKMKKGFKKIDLAYIWQNQQEKQQEFSHNQ